MAITRVGSPVTAITPSEADYLDITIGSVTSGNVVILMAAFYTGPTGDTTLFSASSVARQSGPTIGTIVCDVAASQKGMGGEDGQADLAIWRIPITSSGSNLVLRVTAPTSSTLDHYSWMAAQEVSFSGTLSCQDTSSATFVHTSTATADRSSGDADSTGAALFIGAIACGTSAADAIDIVGTGWVGLAENEDWITGMGGAMSYREVTGATTDDAVFNVDSSWNYEAVAVAVYQESGGGGVVRNPVPMGFVVG